VNVIPPTAAFHWIYSASYSSNDQETANILSFLCQIFVFLPAVKIKLQTVINLCKFARKDHCHWKEQQWKTNL